MLTSGKYTGTLIHDHETGMYHFGAEHGECNVHLLRYLKKNTEESGNHWSEELTQFLCDANRQKKERLRYARWFSEDEQKAFSQAYDAIVEKGEMENKAVTKRIAHAYEKALLNRLVSYKRYHLLFLHREDVSFDNNESERNLRKCKNRQKMSGGFREKSGMLMYCTLLSFFETVKKNMGNPYQAAYSAWAEL
ncbi:MAG: transposase [Clostridia bacterium]|nr:transposase [Clostridia bacterium]